jgi:cytochrome P450
VNDPNFIEQLYAGSGKKREKYKTTIDGVCAPCSVLATKDHDLHRRRRAVLNPFFSKQSIRRVEPIIQRTLNKLLGRMEEWGCLGVPAPMKLAYKATTKDIIHAYAFGNTHDYEFLDMKDMGEAFFETIEPSRTAQLGVYFGWLNP